MGTPTSNIDGLPERRRTVAYMDPSGGLNTKRDSHALDRNQAAISQNMWPAADNALAKRPGTAACVTNTGATGSGAAGTQLVASRWPVAGVNTTYLLNQAGTALRYAKLSDANWTAISTALGATPQRIHVAQMYDPTAGGVRLFICDGVDTPKIWAGPGVNTLATVTTSAGYLPSNNTNAAPITPRFVETDEQSLFYAGEPSSPSAVYVSDPFYPQQFNFAAITTSPYGGNFQPQLIGNNDGINGGAITGLARLGAAMLVFKESAIYAMTLTSLFGETAYQVQTVSSSIGCVAPESIVKFDQFVVFLAIDGLYYTDGLQTVQISASVPTFFDGSLTGQTATCLAKSTATSVRSGSKYIVFYDGGTVAAPSTSAGYPTKGLWFDFSKPDYAGLPTCGEIIGYAPAGLAALNGPTDDGNWCWTDATQDRVGKFGIGYSDFGLAIQSTFFGKSDMMLDIYSDSAPVRTKALQNVWVILAIPAPSVETSLTFGVNVVCEFFTLLSGSGNTAQIGSLGGTWGQNWGTMIWAAPQGATEYSVVRVDQQATAQGRVLQIGITESSIYEWILLGYVIEIDTHEIEQ